MVKRKGEHLTKSTQFISSFADTNNSQCTCSYSNMQAALQFAKSSRKDELMHLKIPLKQTL